MATGVRDTIEVRRRTQCHRASPDPKSKTDSRPARSSSVSRSATRCNTPRCDCRGPTARARLQRDQCARRPSSGADASPKSARSRVISTNAEEVVMSSLEIRVDPSAMGLRPRATRAHRAALRHVRRGPTTRRLARHGRARRGTGVERQGRTPRPREESSRSPTTRSGASIR